MKKIIVLLLLVGFIIGCTEKIPNNVIKAKISFLKGHVTVLRQSKELKAKLNMFLLPSDIIKTDHTGELNLIVAGFGVCKIKQNTEITVDSLLKKTEDEIIQFSIAKGKVFSSLKKLKRGSSFQINTPTAVAGIRGTTFLVDVTDTEAKVAVFAGKIEIKDKKNEKEKVIATELTEAIVPQTDFKKTKVIKMKNETFQEIKELVKTEEIKKVELKEVKEEISNAVIKWEKLEKKKAEKKESQSKESDTVKW